MLSDVLICNLALANIGKETISAMTQAGAEARACSLYYGPTLNMMLQSYPWRFAGRSVTLAEITNDKTGQWAHAYQHPTDCLKVRWVRPEYSADTGAMSTQDEIGFPHEVEGQAIYCDLTPAVLRYTTSDVDASMFPALFADAMSWHLAARLALPLTRDPSVRAEALKFANMMTGQAQMADANEQRETTDHDSEFVTVRADG